LLLGSQGPDEFITSIDEVACEFAAVMAEDFPGENLPPNLADRCARAIKEAVAATPEDDIVAKQILQANGAARRVRASWRVVSASLTVSAIAGVAAGWGVHEKTGRNAESVIAGLLAATAIQGVELAAFGIASGNALQAAHQALRALVDALLGPNVPDWRSLTLTDTLRDVPLARMITDQLTRTVGSLGYRDSTSARGSPVEVVWRWDGEQRNAIEAAAKETGKALKQLSPHPEWKAPWCVLERSKDLLDSAGTGDPLEVQWGNGSLVFELLVCSAAVARELENALMPVVPAWAA
jgi:hypothetical protein